MATDRYDGEAPVNIGAGFEIAIRDLTALVALKCEFRGEIVWDTTQPNGQPRRSLDTSRAAEYFGFRAETPFEDGLDRTIAWYRAARVAPIINRADSASFV